MQHHHTASRLAALAGPLLLVGACGGDAPVQPARTPLEVVRTVPWPEATSVPVDVELVVVFQRDVDPEEIPAGAFVLDAAPLAVQDMHGPRVVLRPPAALEYNRLYLARVVREAWGATPGAPRADHSWRFATDPGPPGLTWGAEDSGTPEDLASVSQNVDGLYAAGDAGTLLFSALGVSWTRREYTVPQVDLSIVLRRGGVDLLLDSLGRIFVSRGVAWELWSPPGVPGLQARTMDVGRTWVMGGKLGANEGVLVSFDGTESLTTSLGAQVPADVFWAGFDAQWVAVLADGGILRSPDGQSWVSSTVPGGGHELRSVAGRAAGAHGPRRYVAVGGAIFVSDAAQDWMLAALPSAPLLQVIWTGEHFVAVGAGGVAMSSPDGLTWTLHDTETAVNLMGVAAPSGGSRWIVVGEGGTILGSPARIPRQGP